MSLATSTATTAELVTLHEKVYNLEIMLRPYRDGSALVATKPGRFTEAEIDTQITAVSAAITAVNA